MSLDNNFIFGFLGILFTVASGILSIYLVKRKKYPGSIIYIEDRSIDLFNFLVKNFSEINITYKHKNITQQIALVRGFLINNGSIDINPSMIEKNVTLNLPNNFKWLSAKITDQTAGNISTLEIFDENVIEVKLELFRRNEFIAFEALAEVPVNEEEIDSGFVLSENITFNHRISDTNRIKKEYVNLNVPKFWTFKRLIYPIIGIALFSLLVFLGSKFSNEKVIECSITNKINHKTIFGFVDVTNELKIKIIEENGETLKVMDIKDFNINYYVSSLKISKIPFPDTITRSFRWIVIGFGSIFLILSMIPFAVRYFEYKKALTFNKILN